MLKKICYLVFYFVVFLFLFIVFCGNVYAKDNSVELKWIQKDISNDPNYRGNIIIAEMNDGYFTINNLGDIVKYDFNGKKIETLVNDFADIISNAFIDDNYLVIFTENRYIYKFSLDSGKLILKKDLNKFVDDDGYQAEFSDLFSIADGYLISVYYYYEDKVPKLLKLDKDGELIKSFDYNEYSYFNLFANNKGEFLAFIVKTLENNEEKAEFHIINADNDILFSKEIDFIPELIKDVGNGYLFCDYNYSEEISFMDYQGNILWSRTYNNILGSYYKFTDFAVVDDYYIITGYKRSYDYPFIMIVDKNGKFKDINMLNYGDFYDYPVGKIIVLDNGDYIINFNMRIGMYDNGFGSVIVKYGTADYEIKVKTIGGGNVKVVSTGKEGDEIYYRIEPDSGYQLESLKVTTVSGKNIDIIDNNMFLLPDEDVVIEARFTLIVDVPDTGMFNTVFRIVGILIIVVGIFDIVVNLRKKESH